MANTYFASGIVFGAGGVTGTLGSLSDLTLLQDVSVEEQADKEEVKDAVYSNKRRQVTASFYPTGGSAHGTLVATVPLVGSTVTIADANFTATNDIYIVDSVKVARGSGKVGMADITLLAYLENSVP
jgi:hypothetical protein